MTARGARGPAVYVTKGRETGRPERAAAQGPAMRLYALGAAVVSLPFALVATVIEVAARNGGTIYVEARRDAKTPAR